MVPPTTAEAGSASTAEPASASGNDVVLVRHGETAWSKAGRHTGRTDVALTEHGRSQARALAAALPRDVALTLASPLQRARDTASLAGFEAEQDADLVELDYGAYEGLTTAQIRIDSPLWTVWTGELPGGETLEAAALRADRVIARALAAEGTVILFSHGHFLRVLAARWLGLPPAYGAHLVLDTATLSLLGHEHGTRALRRWNVTP